MKLLSFFGITGDIPEWDDFIYQLLNQPVSQIPCDKPLKCKLAKKWSSIHDVLAMPNEDLVSLPDCPLRRNWPNGARPSCPDMNDIEFLWGLFYSHIALIFKKLNVPANRGKVDIAAINCLASISDCSPKTIGDDGIILYDVAIKQTLIVDDLGVITPVGIGLILPNGLVVTHVPTAPAVIAANDKRGQGNAEASDAGQGGTGKAAVIHQPELTQKAAAEIARVEIRTIQNWENGIRRPPAGYPGRNDAVQFNYWARRYLASKRDRQQVRRKRNAGSSDFSKNRELEDTDGINSLDQLIEHEQNTNKTRTR